MATDIRCLKGCTRGDDHHGVCRDRWTRPLILTPETGEVQAYTRASTFANALDDAYGLAVWKQRLLAVGLGQNEDLTALLATLDVAQKDEVDGLIETALDRAGANAKAHWGTAVHAFTEIQGLPYVPKRFLPDVSSYFDKLEEHDLRITVTERFVVQDEVKVAGTFDHLVFSEDHGNVVLDKKSGSMHPGPMAVQLALYAHSAFYDPATGEREPLPEANQEWAVVAHMPAGAGETHLYWVDIAKGWEAVSLAAQVREYRKAGKKFAVPFG